MPHSIDAGEHRPTIVTRLGEGPRSSGGFPLTSRRWTRARVLGGCEIRPRAGGSPPGQAANRHEGARGNSRARRPRTGLLDPFWSSFRVASDGTRACLASAVDHPGEVPDGNDPTFCSLDGVARHRPRGFGRRPTLHGLGSPVTSGSTRVEGRRTSPTSAPAADCRRSPAMGSLPTTARPTMLAATTSISSRCPGSPWDRCLETSRARASRRRIDHGEVLGRHATQALQAAGSPPADAPMG